MRTAVVGGMIVGVHCLAVGCVILMGGCGRTTKSHSRVVPPQQDIAEERVVMPPSDVPVTPPLVPVVTPPPVVEPAVTAPAETQKYQVKRGDSLSLIAQRHGVSLKEVMSLNKITNPNKLKVGQELVLPAGVKPKVTRPKSTPKPVVAGEGMQVYVVAKGDCLSKIAARFGTSTKALREKNQLSSDNLQVGQKLVVPAGAAAAAAPVAAEPAPAVPAEAPAPEASLPPAEPVAMPSAVPAPASGDAAVPAAAPIIHDVAAGETLDMIADKYAVPVDKLMIVNGLVSKDITGIRTLKIPQGN